MRYKKIIISIACICFFNCSFGQFNAFIKNFKKCSLPFIAKAETFDMYTSDDPYVISETDFVKYLMMENDTFINIKGSASIGYHKYMAVCKLGVYNDFLGVLYFRYIINEEGNHIQELMLCIFTKKGKLTSAYPISGYYTANNKQFYSTIFSEENIEILFYRLDINDEFTSENVIEKKYLYITKEGLIQSRK